MGRICLTRTYLVCVHCRDSAFPLDDRMGIDDYLTHEARRLVSLAGASWSFEVAADRLQDFCGLKVSHEFIRQTTEAAGAKMAQWMETDPAATTSFQAAAGEPEFQTDAAKVNTTTGWRDMKIGLFCKRPLGESATTAEWATRSLPKATARFGFAAITDSQTFAQNWRPTAERLGLNPDTPELSVLADGADWIWNRAAEAFPAAAGVLDVYHAIEHVATAAKACCGDGSVAAREQLDRGRTMLLADGYLGVEEWVATLPPDQVNGSATGSLLNYMAGHRDRLNYALRLHRGQSIGSGQIEGAAKNMIGRRMKLNSCRWLETNANRMCGVVSALYCDRWTTYWSAV